MWTLSAISPPILFSSPSVEKAFNFAFRHPKDDARINILEGAVRSAKTWSMLPKLLQLCEYDVQGWRVITGVSKQTVYNNVLNDLFDLIEPETTTTTGRLANSTCSAVSGRSSALKTKVRKSTFEALLLVWRMVDEGVLQPPSFIRMLSIVCRLTGLGLISPPTQIRHITPSRLNFSTTKSFAPTAVSGRNTSISMTTRIRPAYKRHLKALYKGVYYQRFVLGLWVVAEGAIYKDCWDEDILYDDSTAPKRLRGELKVEEYIGVDCGVDHPQVYLYVIDDGTTLWVDNEYYWDSRKEMRQKTEREYRVGP